MIQSYSKYKQFHASVLAKDNGKAVRQGLDFLRFVAEEYIRLEVYNNQECDGDDFFTYQVEKELAQVLRDEETPLGAVAIAQKEMGEIEKMEAYDDCSNFVGDYAAFMAPDGKYGVIGRDGKVVVPAKYKRVEVLPRARATVTYASGIEKTVNIRQF